MRILILGSAGLIGHKLFQKLSLRFGSDKIFGTVHTTKSSIDRFKEIKAENIIEHVDVMNFDALTGIIKAINPSVILNCVGITKRREEILDIAVPIQINSLFPHRLATWAGENKMRVIHFSTDCVFDGEVGNYNEESPTTAIDTYGKTKALGEIKYDHSLTIRSSFIGRELSHKSELLEWVISQNGQKIKGFQKAMYSGISTIFMAKVVGDIIEFHPELSGLHQLAIDEPISKYDLICLARDKFNLDMEVEKDSAYSIKPTLDGSNLKRLLNLEIPSWDEMMTSLSEENKDYN